MLFLFTADRHLAYGPCSENPNQVINFVNNRHIQWTLARGHLLCHAAAVARNGRGLAVAGRSGMGKSTLALELMTRDLDFISNDRLMIRRDGASVEMLGVAKLPRINPGTALNNPFLSSVMPEDDVRTVSGLSEQELWNLEQKYDVYIDQCFGPGKFRLSAEMAGLIVLNWSLDAGEPILEAIELEHREDLLAAFRKDVGLFYLPGTGILEPDRTARAYLDVLGDCPVIEVSGGIDFRVAADRCLPLLLGRG
jgi:HprK-related kinase B